MKFITLSCAVLLLLTTSCSKQLLISNGAHDNKPLIFNSEYKLEQLKEIEVDGSAFWGIPSFSKNNKNNHKNGMLVTFNGVEVGKLSRILPIVSMLGYTAISAVGVQELFGYKDKTVDAGFGFTYTERKRRLSLAPAAIIGLPIAGTLNNLTWNNAAFSGASATLNYRLINENPDVDVFYYPKYDIRKKNIFSEEGIKLKYLWFQEASIKAKVAGAKQIKSK